MDPTTGTVSCGDSRGNTYTKDVDVVNGTVVAGVRTVICSAPVTVALLAGDLVTVSHPNAAAKALSVNEFSGVGAIDRTASTTGTSTTPSSKSTPLARTRSVSPRCRLRKRKSSAVAKPTGGRNA